MSRKKEIKGGKKPGSPAWMVTYGDMMTLLLCFFVLLYSMSTLDLERFSLIISQLQQQLGVLDGGRTISREQLIEAGQRDELLGQIERSRLEFEQLYMEIMAYLEKKGLEDQVEVAFVDEGLLIRFPGRILFDLGRADLISEAREILGEMASFFGSVENEVTVEGHTDDWPISTEEFPSNWELSTTRATNVIRYLIEQKDLPPEQFSAAGYGEYQPIRPNDSPENRALNRRVDILIRRSIEFDLLWRKEGLYDEG